ncbi:MAG: flavodoxin family protein [Oribacterium sp.]|jgi:multimeric flavodoxin WrbA|nr:flavodoxin family protein [Oribacterium sp.]MDY6317133.1 flavodoxin family protein [Oribacterium sp.]
MKVLLVNGSSHPDGCTNRALQEIAKSLKEEGIDSEVYFIGNKPLTDCIACHKCTELGKCVFDDCVNEFAEKAKEADGFVFGSPVYYAHPSGRLISFMDRLFYSSGENLAFKPAAAIFSARRNGQVCSMDVINKYFSINQMPIVSATYWNHVFGAKKEDVEEDVEGLNTMYNLGKNMAWMLKLIELGKKNGLPHPENVHLFTNFVR